MNLSKLRNSEGQGSLVCCIPWGRLRVGHKSPPRNEQLCANNVYNLDEMKKAWGWENGWGWSKGTNLLYKINKSGGYNIHPGDYSYDIVYLKLAKR